MGIYELQDYLTDGKATYGHKTESKFPVPRLNRFVPAIFKPAAPASPSIAAGKVQLPHECSRFILDLAACLWLAVGSLIFDLLFINRSMPTQPA